MPDTTAFVFAGGGSFGAIQVGMLHEVCAHGIVADLVVGAPVGATNAAYFAADPGFPCVQRLESIWRGLRREDVFPTGMGRSAACSRCCAAWTTWCRPMRYGG